MKREVISMTKKEFNRCEVIMKAREGIVAVKEAAEALEFSAV
jgi:hypothetical protein